MDFKTFDFVVIYNIVAKNFIYIYKIVLGAGWGGSAWDPKGQGWGKVVCPAPQGGAGMGKGNNHVRRGRRSHPSAPPRPIAIPIGRSSGQAFLASSSLALMILSSVQLVTSVCPFACGCPGDDNWFLIPRPKQKSLKL